MDARIKRLEALFESKQPFNESFTDEKGSCSVKLRPLVDEEVMDKLETHGKKQVTDGDDDDVQMVSDDEALQGKLVGLKMESGADIAAYGTIIKVDAPKNCIRVSIDQAVDENAVLPIPMDDCQSIGEAVGSHVSWPMHLIKLSDVNPKRKKAILSKNVKTLDPSAVPGGLHMLYCYSKMLLSHKGNIMITLPQNVFGHERTLYVNFEDIEPFCHLKPISYTCIAVYIWYLYTRLERENKLKRFRFVDPYGVGYVAWTKKGKDALNEQTEERARSLANRLIGTLSDQIVVVPCNVGEHWILTVIDPHKEHVYILDPLYTRIKDESWKKAVDLAIKMFNVDVQRKGRKQVKWEIIRGPSQPDAYQCGFYVMRYMRQLVDLDVSVDLDSLQLRFTQEEYSKEEIDEVRSEWATCVQRHVQEY